MRQSRCRRAVACSAGDNNLTGNDGCGGAALDKSPNKHHIAFRSSKRKGPEEGSSAEYASSGGAVWEPSSDKHLIVLESNAALSKKDSEHLLDSANAKATHSMNLVDAKNKI